LFVEHTGQNRTALVRTKVQLLLGMAVGFLLAVMIGVASADETPSSNPVLPETELAPAVVVAAGADSIDLNAVVRVSADHRGSLERGTAFQLNDGRLVTVAHAIVDARLVTIERGNRPVVINDVDTNSALQINRQHDLAAIDHPVLNRGLDAADEPAVVGQVLAVAGIGRDGEISVTTGTVISRTTGVNYGIGRPDIYVLSAPIEAGWSGGPVVNGDGEVVAIIVGQETRSGVALAVPVEHVPQP